MTEHQAVLTAVNWWIIIDILCIKLWWVAGNWSMVAMYIAWTINCIYGWVNWSKESK